MKKLGKLLSLLVLLCFTACEDPGNQGSGSDPADTVSVSDPTDQPGTTTTAPPEKPDCQISGEVLEGNRFWASKENLEVVIAAGPDTQDPDFGASHRILMVYDGNTCEQIYQEILPVNLSPDYPYFLSDITYNNLSKVVAIRGFDKIYIYDLEKRILSRPLVPKFLNERFVDDAQSGSVQRLEVWEKYLIGYAASMGPFVFDMSKPQQSQPVLPVAEFELEEGTNYNSLFMLKSTNDDNGYQAILPKFNANTGDFAINPLFQKPLNVATNINPRFRNNRFLVLKELLGGSESRPIGIDMLEMKKYELPEEVQRLKDAEVIEWMKKNRQ